jgi:ribosomal protection tetracycline resistance protein
MRALERAGTAVCEPFVRADVEIPAASIGTVMPVLARLGAAVEASTPRDALSVVEAVLPAARANELRRRLPALTGGEGVLEASFDGYRPVSGERPARPRTTPNPLNLDEYLMHLAGRGVPAARA